MRRFAKFILFSLFFFLALILFLTRSHLKEMENSLKLWAKLEIKRAPHDPELQFQEVVFPSSKTNETTKLYPWKAICDERSDGLDKAVLIFVLSIESLLLNIDEISNLMTCNLYKSSGEDFEQYPNNFKLFAQPRLTGTFIVCPFKRDLNCPRFVSLKFKNQKTTNFLPVQLQNKGRIKKISDEKGAKIAVLAPVISPGNSFSHIRLTEYFEYNKLIGVDHVFIPVPNPLLYDIKLSESMNKVLETYEQEGFVTRYQAPLSPKKYLKQSAFIWTRSNRAHHMR